MFIQYMLQPGSSSKAVTIITKSVWSPIRTKRPHRSCKSVHLVERWIFVLLRNFSSWTFSSSNNCQYLKTTYWVQGTQKRNSTKNSISIFLDDPSKFLYTIWEGKYKWIFELKESTECGRKWCSAVKWTLLRLHLRHDVSPLFFSLRAPYLQYIYLFPRTVFIF